MLRLLFSFTVSEYAYYLNLWIFFCSVSSLSDIHLPDSCMRRIKTWTEHCLTHWSSEWAKRTKKEGGRVPRLRRELNNRQHRLWRSYLLMSRKVCTCSQQSWPVSKFINSLPYEQRMRSSVGMSALLYYNTIIVKSLFTPLAKSSACYSSLQWEDILWRICTSCV